MSLPRYSEYKDSGVAWLAEIPAQWELKRLGYFFDERREKVSDKDFPALSVTKNGIVPQLETAAKTDDGDNRKKVCSGDFVINSRSDRKGSSGISSLDGSVSLINTVLRPRAEVVPGYVHQLLRSQSFQEEFYRFGKGIVADLWSTNYSEMSNITLALPSRQEQTAIAAFLDRETAKIDGLIAEQEKLIALLAEKRQATISHAVTKGLNPDAPMKDSGVVWLGEVPAHWEIKSIRHILDAIGDVDHFMPASVEKGIPYLMTGDLKEFVSQVSLDDCKQISHNDYFELSKKIKSAKGDVIMARYATIGTLMYVDVDVDFLVSYSCVTLKTNHSEVSGLYLFQYMKSDAFRQGIENQINTNTQSNVGIKDLQSVKIVAPPIKEQADIATFLDTETARLDELTAEATHGIALLKERRSALISAAVTGKIDVREANNQ